MMLLGSRKKIIIRFMAANNLAKDDFRFQHAFLINKKYLIFCCTFNLLNRTYNKIFVQYIQEDHKIMRGILDPLHEKYKPIFQY